MAKRKEGQKKGYLGHRSHGRGNCKNRRGSGNRGGRGMAGIDKHKWSWAMKYIPDYFGKFGFARPVHTKKTYDVVNLFDISQRALAEKLEKKDGKYHLDFEGKVLGTGSVTVPLVIRAHSWSKNVEKKLGAAGGAISKLETGKPKPHPTQAAQKSGAKPEAKPGTHAKPESHGKSAAEAHGKSPAAPAKSS